MQKKVSFVVLTVFVLGAVWFFWTRYSGKSSAVPPSVSTVQKSPLQNSSGNWNATNNASSTSGTPSSAATTRSS